MLGAKKDIRDKEDADHLKIDKALKQPCSSSSPCPALRTYTMTLHILDKLPKNNGAEKRPKKSKANG